MRYILLSVSLLFLSATASAYPVRIASWNLKRDLQTLDRLQVSVDNIDRRLGQIVADVRDDSVWQKVLAAGFDVVKLPDTAKENALRLHSAPNSGATREEYYSYDQYVQFMNSTAAQYPAICSLVQIGTSIQNRQLLFLKITDNPAQEEHEPEFKYISSIHGNEVVGYDMSIRLIQLLTSQYGTDTRITDLVNGTEIWICPLMNPDGFVLGQRYNAAGVDLNRNFPMPTGEQHPDGNAWAPESMAMMSFSNAHTFNLSANFHCGALVMNYPWDYTFILAPDDALLQAAALTYAIHNQPMYESDDFPNGITNGAQWYVITGSMQDWNYGLTGNTDITAEISEAYWPPASTLPTYWSQNQESMLSYLEFVHKGLHGTVTSSTGTPLAATITVTGNSKVAYTDPDAGDYHRLLLPGSYTITVQAPGFLPQITQVTIPIGGSATRDFILEPAGSVDFFGQIRSSDGSGLGGLQVTLSGTPPLSTCADANGSFSLLGVSEGLYQISFAQGSSILYETSFMLTTAQNRQVFVHSEPLTLFNDPCESMQNWTANAPWGTSTYLGESVITDSPTGNYANNSYRSLRLTAAISLQNITNPTLSFKTAYDLENGYDYVLVQASTTLNNWTNLGSITGSSPSWQILSYSLEQFAGESVYLRFVLDSDYSVSGDGIYLDDIRVRGTDPSLLIFGDADGNGQVTQADVQCLLDYTVGFDPLPQSDPLPWEASRVAACDVDESLVLDSTDAFLILRYLLDPQFRFEVQSGEELQLDPVTLAATQVSSPEDVIYRLGFTPVVDLRCLDLQLSPTNQIDLTEVQELPLPGIGLYAFNPDQCRYAWIYDGTPLEAILVRFQTTLTSIGLNYNVNGFLGEAELPINTATDDDSSPRPHFSLGQNYPNPFNPATAIVFSLPAAQEATLTIYNAKGQEVAVVLRGKLPAGTHRVVWDGRDKSGQPVSSGVYVYNLSSVGVGLQRRMVLLK